MTEDFFFGWLAGFGGMLTGWLLAELGFWWRHIRERHGSENARAP